jgi:flagellar assembly protein FliH
LSRVFKQSPSFIPEKIVAGSIQPKSGWRSVSIRENQSKASSVDTEDEQFLQRPPHEQDFSGIDGNENPESSHKADFSTPDASAPLEEETDRAETTDDLTIEPHPEPVNIELLQEEAYNRGLQDGLARAEEDFGTGTKVLLMVCQELNVLRETILNNSMDEMQNLVLIIAEKIIRHSVIEQDRTIIDTVREAIHQAVKSDEFVIQVNPADLTIINAKSKEFIDSVNGLENIIVQADPSIDQGGCKVDSSTSTVDATVANQLRIIENVLKGKT